MSAASLDRLHRLLDADTALVMGVVNVTPDSFSDGGRFLAATDAVAHGLRLMDEGADIVDVGGESTRPGAAPVAVEDELQRVVPVVRELAAAGVVVSIDTRHSPVAEAALDAGAVLVNDVSGLRDPRMVRIAAERAAPVVIMHMPVDDPATMQRHTGYADVVAEVVSFLAAQAATALAAGVPRVILDPGIGFGKTAEQNVELLRGLGEVVALGHPVLVGASRKRFIDALAGAPEPTERLPGTLAAHLAAVGRGARIVRVHDVAAHRQALAVWRHLVPGRGLEPLYAGPKPAVLPLNDPGAFARHDTPR